MTRDSLAGRMAHRVFAWCCVVAVVASLAGCATSGGIGLAINRDEQALKEAVAADNFPTAAELGIAAGTTAPTR